VKRDGVAPLLRGFCAILRRFCTAIARPLRFTQNVAVDGFMEKFLWIKKAGQFSQGSPEGKRGLSLRRIVI